MQQTTLSVKMVANWANSILLRTVQVFWLLQIVVPPLSCGDARNQDQHSLLTMPTSKVT